MILDLFSSSKVTRELIDTSSNKEAQGSSGRIVHAQCGGRSKIEQNEIFFMTAMVAGESGTSASQTLYSGRERELSLAIRRLSILWFGPCGAFFRPGRLIQKPARAAAVKDGRHRNHSTCSPLPGHP